MLLALLIGGSKHRTLLQLKVVKFTSIRYKYINTNTTIW